MEQAQRASEDKLREADEYTQIALEAANWAHGDGRGESMDNLRVMSAGANSSASEWKNISIFRRLSKRIHPDDRDPI